MDYDLDAQPGSCSVTGVDSGWDYDRLFNAEPGAFAAEGNFPVNIDARVLASPFPDVQLLFLNDFSSAVAGQVSFWKLEGQTGPSTYVVLPCQYWKATLWSYRLTLPGGGTNYMEAMIPNASAYASTINASTSFRLKQLFKLSNGTQFENVFFSFGSYPSASTVVTREFTSGSNQDSCLVKGSFRLPEDVDYTATTRTLQGVRSYTNSNSRKKVVCKFDPVILPGMNVTVGVDTFMAKTITFYVSATDQWMEVHDTHV